MSLDTENDAYLFTGRGTLTLKIVLLLVLYVFQICFWDDMAVCASLTLGTGTWFHLTCSVPEFCSAVSRWKLQLDFSRSWGCSLTALMSGLTGSYSCYILAWGKSLFWFLSLIFRRNTNGVKSLLLTFSVCFVNTRSLSYYWGKMVWLPWQSCSNLALESVNPGMLCF